MGLFSFAHKWEFQVNHFNELWFAATNCTNYSSLRKDLIPFVVVFNQAFQTDNGPRLFLCDKVGSAHWPFLKKKTRSLTFLGVLHRNLCKTPLGFELKCSPKITPLNMVSEVSMWCVWMKPEMWSQTVSLDYSYSFWNIWFSLIF